MRRSVVMLCELPANVGRGDAVTASDDRPTTVRLTDADTPPAETYVGNVTRTVTTPPAVAFANTVTRPEEDTDARDAPLVTA